MKTRSYLIMFSAFALSSACFGGAAQDIAEADQATINCHAAKASIQIVLKALSAVKAGEPLSDMSSAELVRSAFDGEISPSLSIVEAKFPNSPEHVASFHSALASNLGAFGQSLKSGETGFFRHLSEEMKPCKDDYTN